MATISVTNNPAPGNPNFSPQNTDAKFNGQVFMQSTATDAVPVYTWIGTPSSTNPPQAVFTSGSPPYSVPRNATSWTLLNTIRAGTTLTLSIYPTGSPSGSYADDEEEDEDKDEVIVHGGDSADDDGDEGEEEEDEDEEEDEEEADDYDDGTGGGGLNGTVVIKP
ncbi:MAG: hypothetical protein K8W52_01020 [Deltaproteobacteria bacterium]|nr:hypothetical protein [Deltaproteobacteria bacterium]